MPVRASRRISASEEHLRSYNAGMGIRLVSFPQISNITNACLLDIPRHILKASTWQGRSGIGPRPWNPGQHGGAAVKGAFSRSFSLECGVSAGRNHAIARQRCNWFLEFLFCGVQFLDVSPLWQAHAMTGSRERLGAVARGLAVLFRSDSRR
ncbi:hypothetical protein N657DRAFT_350242 [Parathielavia appendiculata]|uniref:Uncharacterized protein n=1 Tax=Parathielavia appendiculata TaxID=2587402 RepID=A0AAN6U2D6_9PEZI|nr:hypothetical protein N657DRAFT_350242 [Parathielavia appendiculata]